MPTVRGSSSKGSGTSARRSSSQPVTARDRALSRKHLQESVTFNKKHADEHKKAMKDDQKQLKKLAKSKAKSRKS